MPYVFWACENVLGEHGYIFTVATRCCGSFLEMGGWAGALFQPLTNTLRVIAALCSLAQTDWDAAKRRESKMSGLVGKKSYCTSTVFSILSALEMDIWLPRTSRTTNSPYISEVWTWKFKWANSKRSSFSGFKLKEKVCNLWSRLFYCSAFGESKLNDA